MRQLLPLFLAVGCVASELDTDLQQAPPPGSGLLLSHGALVIEGPLTLTATGALPGETVRFAFSTQVGAGPCPPIFGGLCLDLVAPSVLGSAVADAAGTTYIILTVPPTVPEGASANFQAVIARGTGGSSSEKSPPVSSVAQHLWVDPVHTAVWIAGLPAQAVWRNSPSLAGLPVSLWVDNTRRIDLGIASATGVGSASAQATLASAVGQRYTLRVRSGAVTYASSPFSVGTMLGFSWFGSAQHMVRFDPLTGASVDLGTVGDLATWAGQTLIDRTTQTVFVQGDNSAGVRKLYQLDALTGAFLGEILFPEYLTGEQLLASGDMLNFRWNGTQEEMVVIDPWTGFSSVRAIVGDLATWAGQSVYDPARGVVWVLGLNPSGQRKVWGLDVATGALIVDRPQPEDLGLGLQILPSGDIVGARWNGSAQEVVRFTPTTGAVQVLGQLGDLRTWFGTTVLHPTDGTLYAWGNNGTSYKLYAFDTHTGALSAQFTLPRSTETSGQLLVY
jgi:hypothetical protein